MNDNHLVLPPIGLGTGPSKGEGAVAFLAHAIGSGYRLLDSAAHYRNEREVGEAVRVCRVPRDQIVVTTKIWPDRHHADDLRRSAEESLERLGLDRIDLLLLHWPNPQVPFAETFAALNQLRREGLAREIGVSNFTTRFLEEAVALSEAPIVANQIEYHPYLGQDAVLEYCRNKGIAVIAHCPLGRVGTLFAEHAVASSAARHNKTLAQVVLRWHVQQGVIPIPGTTKPDRLRENLEIFDFALDESEMAAISLLSAKHHRICVPPVPYEWDPA